MKGLRIDLKDQNSGDCATDHTAPKDPERGDRTRFKHDLLAQLCPRRTEVSEDAEFASARQGLSPKCGCDANQANPDGGGFEGIGDGETAIENRQRERSNLCRAAQIKSCIGGQACLYGGCDGVGVCAWFEPDRSVAHRAVAGQALVVARTDDDGPVLARVVPPDASDHK